MAQAYGAGSPQGSVDARVALLAAAQFGVFSRSQVARLGVTRGMIHHRVRTGRWHRPARDVFVLAGVPTSWRQSLMAACLAWGDGTVVSHRAAAALWALAPFEPGPIEITVPRGRRRAAPGIVHENVLARTDIVRLDGFRLTSPARTLIDLASVVPPEMVEEAMDDAFRRGLVSIRRLRRELALPDRRGRPGITVMRALLEQRDPGRAVPQSIFETRMLRVLRAAGLPRPETQHRIRARGRAIVVDFAYPSEQLAIETDGYRWHSGRISWEHDRARLNLLMLLGWRVVHVTWTDLHEDPAGVTTRVRAALDQPAR